MAKSKARFLGEILGSDGKIEKAKTDAAITAGANLSLAADGTLTTTTLPLSGGALTGAVTTNSTFDGVDIAARDAVLTSTTTTAGAALPKAGGTMTGNLVMSNTSPQLQFQTGSSHYNWQIAAQENVSNALEISSGSADADATNDTYTPRVVVLSSGNVGIGTTSPAFKLDVQVANGNTLARFKDSDSSHPGIIIAGDTNAGWVGNNVGVTGEGIYYQSSDNLMRFYINSSEKMRVDSSGRLLVNATTTAFSDKLYINGDGYATGGWRTGTGATFVGKLTNSSGKLALQSDASRDIQLGDTNNPDIVYIDTSAQNVGIGTTSPAFTLDVTGSFRATSDAYLQGDLYVNDKIRHNGDVDNYISFPAADTQTFVTANSERMRITSAGDVGIGTTAPNNKLTVTGGSDGINIQGTSSYLRWNSGDMMIRNEGSYAMGFHTYDGSSAQVERMRITSAGNVGIGDDSPDFKLAIRTPAIPSGSTYAWPLDLSRSNTDGRGLSFGVGTSGGPHAIGAHNGDIGIGQTYGTDSNGLPQFYETLSIVHDGTASKGKVGIGTNSPQDALDLYDADDNVGIYFHTATSGVGGGDGLRVGLNNTHAFVWNYENTPLSFGTNGSQKATILANGNVGIGDN